MELGVEVVVVDLVDFVVLMQVFVGVCGVYLVKLFNYVLENLFEYVDVMVCVVVVVVCVMGLLKFVLLLLVGVDWLVGIGVIVINWMVEQWLVELGILVVFLWVVYFMENWVCVVELVCVQGILLSLFGLVEWVILMVVIEDIGCVVVEMLQEDWSGVWKVGLVGLSVYLLVDIVDVFVCVLNWLV